jgi:AraC family transcriptional regulator, transcriptional activator of pobA
MDKYDFFKTKYGSELLIDLIRLERLEKYIINDKSHVLSYYDITLITKGDGIFFLDEFNYRIKPGKIFFTSPMQVRKWEIKTAPKGLVLIFEEEFLCSFFNDLQFVQELSYFNSIISKHVLTLSDNEFCYFQKLLENIEEEIIEHVEKNNHILRALLYQALVWLNREYKKSNPSIEHTTNKHIADFKEQVNKNLKNRHSVNFYADQLNITPGHLNDIVKENLGISAKQYIQNRVFLEAKKLLLYSSLSISEIAWKLNFQDSSYFVRAFKNKIGCTPQTFRNKTNP